MANPIQGIGESASSLSAVTCPSTYEWSEEDVSKSTAGRDEDAYMHKEKIDEKVHLSLGWRNVTTSVASKIIRQFTANEYFYLRYLDLKSGGYETKQFYIGTRSSPLYNASMGVWSNVAFNVIER